MLQSRIRSFDRLDLGASSRVAPSRAAARAMLEVLARHGVATAFGIPGGLIGPVFDALHEVPEISTVVTRHEAMAGYAAMGAFLATGRPSVVLTTGGPGITNAITAMAAAFVEEIPMIVLGGDVPGDAVGRAAMQDSSSSGIDAIAMLRSVTRWTARVDAPEAAPGIAEQAVAYACGPRPGPVFLSVPLNMGSKAIRTSTIALPTPASPAAPDAAACGVLAGELARARKPLLVLGNGARGAAREILALIERLAIPFVTTPHAKGMITEQHALYLGGIGVGGHPSVDDYLAATPDVVLIIGSRLGDYATNSWTIPLCGTHFTAQIDREPGLIGRNYPVSLGIVGDAGLAMKEVLAGLATLEGSPLRQMRSLRRIEANVCASKRAPLHPAQVFAALQEAFPSALWTSDHGEHCAYALHYLSIDKDSSFRLMAGFVAMGTGMGTAIGARCAARGRRVIAICGDGGFAMHAGEILTCVENGIDVVFVVMNDGRYNMVNHGSSAVYGRLPPALPARVADIAGATEALGATSARIEAPEDLDAERLRTLAGQGRPLVLDVRFDPSLSLTASGRAASLRAAVAGGWR